MGLKQPVFKTPNWAFLAHLGQNPYKSELRKEPQWNYRKFELHCRDHRQQNWSSLTSPLFPPLTREFILSLSTTPKGFGFMMSTVTSFLILPPVLPLTPPVTAIPRWSRPFKCRLDNCCICRARIFIIHPRSSWPKNWRLWLPEGAPKGYISATPVLRRWRPPLSWRAGTPNENWTSRFSALFTGVPWARCH